MFTKPDKPFTRTDKNTVKRRGTVTLYEKEIEEFYRELDGDDGASFSTTINTISRETTTQGVRDVLMASLPCVEAIGLDDDLFHAGLDSLLALRVAKCLRSALEKYDMMERRNSPWLRGSYTLTRLSISCQRLSITNSIKRQTALTTLWKRKSRI